MSLLYSLTDIYTSGICQDICILSRYTVLCQDIQYFVKIYVKLYPLYVKLYGLWAYHNNVKI